MSILGPQWFIRLRSEMSIYVAIRGLFLDLFSIGPVVVQLGRVAFAGVVIALLKLPAYSRQVELVVSLGSSVRVGWLRPGLVFEPFRVAALRRVGR